mmetsp:Transcript_1138/g.3619  ORF Transcript_1138/g.3619 Transcript_1138/m.3619 type:complete len:331 (+) Transcript_1138:138-1130(+)
MKGAVPGTAPGQWLRRSVFSVTVGLGTLIGVTQHAARELEYNFMCPIMVVSLAKLLCSLALYARYDGPLAEIPRRIRVDWGVVARYSVVAGLFCLYDVLSFVNSGLLDPQTYLTLLQLRIVVTGAVWALAFARPPSWRQRGALALICLACTATVGPKQGAAPGLSLTHRSLSLVAVQIVANCFAGVANEVLLKQKGEVSLSLQNAVQYTWTLLWCLLAGLLCPLDGVRLNPLNLQEWAKMADLRMLPNIVVLTLLGLVSSLMLKVLDSVWRSVAAAVQLVLTPFVSLLAFGYPLRPVDLCPLCLVVLGVWLYALPAAGPRPRPKEGLREV